MEDEVLLAEAVVAAGIQTPGPQPVCRRRITSTRAST
jgi:hypothetical protein